MSILGGDKEELAVYHSPKKNHTTAAAGGSGPWTWPPPQLQQNLEDADADLHRINISMTQL